MALLTQSKLELISEHCQSNGISEFSYEVTNIVSNKKEGIILKFFEKKEPRNKSVPVKSKQEEAVRRRLTA